MKDSPLRLRTKKKGGRWLIRRMNRSTGIWNVSGVRTISEKEKTSEAQNQKICTESGTQKRFMKIQLDDGANCHVEQKPQIHT